MYWNEKESCIIFGSIGGVTTPNLKGKEGKKALPASSVKRYRNVEATLQGQKLGNKYPDLALPAPHLQSPASAAHWWKSPGYQKVGECNDEVHEDHPSRKESEEWRVSESGESRYLAQGGTLTLVLLYLPLLLISHLVCPIAHEPITTIAYI